MLIKKRTRLFCSFLLSTVLRKYLRGFNVYFVFNEVLYSDNYPTLRSLRNMVCGRGVLWFAPLLFLPFSDIHVHRLLTQMPRHLTQTPPPNNTSFHIFYHANTAFTSAF
ncbi:hypothetical protein BX070DRAFT_221444 [Coemansia spiralis]|nr:hypothetical protein BX070DRAFT_221444 [Coemansia spiralis]